MPKNQYEISIEVSTDYVHEQSEPKVDRYVFAYTITILNRGQMPAKLLSRHWVITDANGKTQEVKGEGVVGEHRSWGGATYWLRAATDQVRVSEHVVRHFQHAT
jgi:uncharacterized protein affecting Mg2+/Co2+ transport